VKTQTEKGSGKSHPAELTGGKITVSIAIQRSGKFSYKRGRDDELVKMQINIRKYPRILLN
jgi:hypothetical protein